MPTQTHGETGDVPFLEEGFSWFQVAPQAPAGLVLPDLLPPTKRLPGFYRAEADPDSPSIYAKQRSIFSREKWLRRLTRIDNKISDFARKLTDRQFFMGAIPAATLFGAMMYGSLVASQEANMARIQQTQIPENVYIKVEPDKPRPELPVSAAKHQHGAQMSTYGSQHKGATGRNQQHPGSRVR